MIPWKALEASPAFQGFPEQNVGSRKKKVKSDSNVERCPAAVAGAGHFTQLEQPTRVPSHQAIISTFMV
jgi:hypothetical protein